MADKKIQELEHVHEEYSEDIKPLMNRFEADLAIQIQSALKKSWFKIINYLKQKDGVEKSVASDLQGILEDSDFAIPLEVLAPLANLVVENQRTIIAALLQETGLQLDDITRVVGVDFDSIPLYGDMLIKRREFLEKTLKKTTIKKAQKIINEGLNSGEGFDRIAIRLARGLQIEESRANLIARTEVNYAFNEGNRNYLEGLGIQKYKVGLATTACPVCRKAAQKTYTIKNKDIFPLHPNCRCVLTPVIPRSWTQAAKSMSSVTEAVVQKSSVDLAKIERNNNSVLEAFTESMSSLKAQIEDIKQTKLKVVKGIEIIKPEKGRDYWTEEEREELRSEVLRERKKLAPVKGEDYFTKGEIREFKKEVTPKKGKDYFTQKDLQKIYDEVNDTPEILRNKLESLKGDERLDASAIQNLESVIKKSEDVQIYLKQAASSGGGTWGSITGTLSNQTDLQNALDAKLDSSYIQDRVDVIYVGKHGDDNNDGKTPDNAVLTLNEAETKAEALTTGPNRVLIQILDPGVYSTGNLTVDDGIDIIGADATLEARLVIRDDSNVQLFRLVDDGSAFPTINKNAGTLNSYVDIKEIDMRGVAGTTTGGVGIRNVGGGGVLVVRTEKLFVCQDGIGVGDQSGGFGHTHFEFADLYLAGDNAVGIQALAGTSIIARGGHILPLGSFAGTVAIDGGIANSELFVVTNQIEADTAITVVDGAKVYVYATEITGDITVAAGGELYIQCLSHSGAITNSGTIKGRIGDTLYSDISASGTFTLSGDPTTNLHAAPKQYVDTNVYRENLFINGGFQVWQRGTGSTSSAAGSRTFLSDRWAVEPSGAAVTQQQSTNVPNGKSPYSLEITGAASVTTVDITQRLEAVDTLSGEVTVSFQLFNNSGSDFTPTLLVATPTATDDWTSSNNRLTQSLQTATNGVWTEVSHTFDTSGYTDIEKGIEIALQIPSGSLVAGDTVRIAQAQLVVGSTVPTYQAKTLATELMKAKRYYQEYRPRGIFNVGYLWAGSGSIYHQSIGFDAEMRDVPTATDTSPTWATSFPSGNQASFYQPASGSYAGSPGVFDITYSLGTKGFTYIFTDSSDFTGIGAGIGRSAFGDDYKVFFDAEL